MSETLSYYNDRIRQLTAILSGKIRRRNELAWLRLASILAAMIFLWQVWPVSHFIAIAAAVISVAIFFYFLSRDLINNYEIKNTESLIRINKTEIAILQHQFTDLPDGLTYRPAVHDYANDLDIFGNASLFQYINRTTAEQAGELLSHWLLTPAPADTIPARQEGIKELSQKTAWRQQLQATGITNHITKATENNISNWLQQKNKFSAAGWKILRLVYPLITITILGLFITGFIPTSLFTLLLVVFFAISLLISKLIMPEYNLLTKITGEVETLTDSIEHIENESFTSLLLQQLQASFRGQEKKASVIINQLKKILDRFDYRFNVVVFIPLNSFLLWDLQQVLILEKWKTNNQSLVSNWYESLAGFEALSSLGNLTFNHPQWNFPVMSANKGTFIAEEMGHPLIPAVKLVRNNFSVEGTGKINLVTGSNMAGKSTFLRSVGVNTVLAMTGAPVCAGYLELYPTRIISTMRVSDNLEESTSTFYAELKKLKTIIEAVNNKENVFLLLDEILRGTNSLDRHTGSDALLRQLISQQAVGLLATHDLELAKLAEQYPANIINYHFDVQVNNEELYFDYKLKRGVCQSMNASLLMKKIGIKL